MAKEFVLVKVPHRYFEEGGRSILENIQKDVHEKTGLDVLIVPLEVEVLVGDMAAEELYRMRDVIERFLRASPPGPEKKEEKPSSRLGEMKLGR